MTLDEFKLDLESRYVDNLSSHHFGISEIISKENELNVLIGHYLTKDERYHFYFTDVYMFLQMNERYLKSEDYEYNYKWRCIIAESNGPVFKEQLMSLTQIPPLHSQKEVSDLIHYRIMTQNVVLEILTPHPPTITIKKV